MRWDLPILQDYINKTLEDALSFGRKADDGDITLCSWKPVTDIYETEEGVVIKAELPGVGKEDVSVEVKDNILTLKGERSADKEVSEEKYYRKERCFGTFHRTFTMRDTVNPDNIKAAFKDGVLEVLVPKAEEDKPTRIKVNIE
ncbi:Hsp20/alpha crystallin family protein [Desulfobacterales bacterium HSG2]|nr:Hsp20/alpha crystallin family protein [Desulfobacterales bacterium HSG2]